MQMLILEAAKAAMKCLYAVMRIFPVNKNKILFLSRQTNGPSLDFSMIQEELRRQCPEVQIVSICKRADGGIGDKLEFMWGMVRSIYHIATASVCVLDTYWPPVSILKKREDLFVIQIWHALGKLKKSGYQALDKEGGRDGKTAHALRMHKNYDIIIAGGKAWNPYYCEAFGVTEDVLRNVGLPRIDHLVQASSAMNEKVRRQYPQFNEKPVVLYVPTFRRNDAGGWDALLKSFDFEHYHLVIKPHPNQILEYDESRVYACPEFATIELLAACDYVITDYSSISLEAAILDKKTYYYLYDYEDYMKNNGMNIDIRKEMPGCVYFSAGELVDAIGNKPYPQPELSRFKQKYLPEELGGSTKAIVQIIREKYGVSL